LLVIADTYVVSIWQEKKGWLVGEFFLLVEIYIFERFNRICLGLFL